MASHLPLLLVPVSAAIAVAAFGPVGLTAPPPAPGASVPADPAALASAPAPTPSRQG